jgi:hypothetical protein
MGLKFKVRVYLGDELIPDEKLKDIVINSPVVSRIVNNVVERTYQTEE